MNLLKQQINKIVLITGMAILVSSCATTRITQSWVVPNHNKSYNDLLIIGIAESEMNRRAYESNFVSELVARGAEAIPSYQIIKSSEKITRETVSKAIKGMAIDAVVVTHVAAVDEETVYRPSMDYTPIYGGSYGSLYSYYPHVTTYVQRPGYYTTHETYTIETNLYDVASEELIWSARSRTFAPGSVDEIIVDLTKLLIDDLTDKNLIKKK